MTKRAKSAVTVEHDKEVWSGARLQLTNKTSGHLLFVAQDADGAKLLSGRVYRIQGGKVGTKRIAHVEYLNPVVGLLHS